MASFFIDRPIFAWVVALLICLGGLISLPNLPVAQYPIIAPPSISISTSYPGATPENLYNSVTRLIDGLEKRNLVVRTPDKVDRRQKFIYLTNKGKEFQQELLHIVEKTLDEAQQNIPAHDMAICKKVLCRVYENLTDK